MSDGVNTVSTVIRKENEIKPAATISAFVGTQDVAKTSRNVKCFFARCAPRPTPRKCAFLPCGNLDFESAATAQNDKFKVSFESSSSRLLIVQT